MVHHALRFIETYPRVVDLHASAFPWLLVVAGGTGALLAFVNLWVIRRLAARAVSRAATGDRAQASWLMAALGTKMLILFGLVWLCIRVYNLALVPFAIGISVLPISLVFTGLWIGSTAGEQGKAEQGKV